MADLTTQKYSDTEIANALSIVIENFGNLTDDIKAYISNQLGVSKEELLQAIREGDEDVKSLLEGNFEKVKAFMDAIDKWADENADGEFNPQQTLLEITEHLSSNDKLLADSKASIASLAKAVTAEIENRIEQGNTISKAVQDAKDAITSLVSAVEKKVDDLTNRVGLLENATNSNTTRVDVIFDAIISLGDKFKADRDKYKVENNDNAV